MPLYDFECTAHDCGHVHEAITSPSRKSVKCPRCGAKAKKIISASGAYCANDDAEWVRSITEIVDKDNPALHCREFLAHPTRANYHRWMQGEGIRHLEPGEKGIDRSKQTVDMDRINRKVMEKDMERRKIVVRG